jgi:AraC-like DNA-binding protein
LIRASAQLNHSPIEKTMMQFYPPPAYEGKSLLLPEPPGHLRHLLIGDFPAIYRSGTWGNYLSQEIRFSDGSFELHHIYASDSIPLFTVRDEPQFALEHLYKGRLSTRVNEDEIIELGGGVTYYMYVPVIRLEARFLNAPVISMCFNHTLDFLKQQVGMYPFMQRFIDAYIADGTNLFSGPLKADHVLNHLWCRLYSELRTYHHPLRLVSVYSQQILFRYCELWEREEKLKDVLSGAAEPQLRYIQLMYRVNEILEKDIRKDHLIADLAIEVGINGSTLKSEFKKVFGTTIRQKLIALRMNFAYNEILSTDREIKNIAMDAGYENASHFDMMFKRKFGIDPRGLRRKMAGK